MSAALLLPAAALCLSACAIMPPRPPSADIPHVVHKASPPPGGTQKWNPLWWFGNADDPVPPVWYKPGQPLRHLRWQSRNPMHNFTFYVIGLKDQNFTRIGREPGGVFARTGGWNWTVIQHGWLRLPFVSYQGRQVKFYLLWREHGNFGLKLNISPPPERKRNRAPSFPLEK